MPIERNEVLPYEEIAQELVDELKKHFTGEYSSIIVSVLSSVIDHEEAVKELLNFIKEGNVSREDIILKSYDLQQDYED